MRGCVDIHASTNVYKTSCLLQMSGEKEAEKMIHRRCPLLSPLENYSLAFANTSGQQSDGYIRGGGELNHSKS